MVSSSGRPTPIREAARVWSLVVGGVFAVVTFALTSGVISAGQATALNDTFTAADLLMSALVGLITAGGSVLSAFRTASASEPHVTPLISPRDGEGHVLVPEIPRAMNGGL